MQKFKVLLVGAIVGIGALSGGASTSSAQLDAGRTVGKTAAFEWDLPVVEPVDDYKYKLIDEFVKKVEKATRGQLNINIHPSSSLYGTNDVFPATIDGRVEIGVLPTVGVSASMPWLGVANLPFLSNSAAEARRDITALEPYYRQELAKIGLKYLMTFVWPPNDLFTTSRSVRTAEDWKGLKIRTFDTNSAALVTALGGTPLTVPVSDVYVALQRGVLDGAVQSAASVRSTKTYEVLKVDNRWQWSYAPTAFLAVNNKAWLKLTQPMRNTILKIIKDGKFAERAWTQWAVANDDSVGFLSSNGMRLVGVTAAEKRKTAIRVRNATWPAWKARAGARGVAALNIALKTK